MEDDFEWCPGSLLHVANAIRTAALTDPSWIAIRTSIGMNGIVLHCSDLPLLHKAGLMKRDTDPLDSVFGQNFPFAFSLAFSSCKKRS